MLVDIKALGPHCEAEPERRGSSRFNPVSALVSLALAHRAKEVAGRSVGIITPYRAQARLVGAMARDTGLHDATISTVHRFQDGEVDVAILDLTIARGKRDLGPLLGGDSWSLAGRLLNVAMSRPRGKLIVVVDGQHLNDQWVKLAHKTGEQALAQVLERLTKSKRSMDLAQFMDALEHLPKYRGALPAATLLSATLHDLRNDRRIGAATNQMFHYVHGGVKPGGWVKRSRDPRNGATPAVIIARGPSMHHDWESVAHDVWRPGWTPGMKRRPEYPISLMAADGHRLAFDLRDVDGSLVLHMPATTKLLAEMFELVPPYMTMKAPQARGSIPDVSPGVASQSEHVTATSIRISVPSSAAGSGTAATTAEQLCPKCRSAVVKVVKRPQSVLRCTSSTCPWECKTGPIVRPVRFNQAR